MNESDRCLYEKCTQTCFVVLQRLDERFLDHYSKRYGLNITTPNCDKSTKNQSVVRDVNGNGNRKRVKKKSEESLKNKPRRKKVKPLCYSDSEDSSSYLDNEQSEKTTNERISEDNSTLNDSKLLDRNSEGSNEPKTEEISHINLETTIPKEEDNHIPSDNIKVSEELFFESTEDGKVPSSIIKNEIAKVEMSCYKEVHYAGNDSSCPCIKDEGIFPDYIESDKNPIACEEKIHDGNYSEELIILKNEHDETVRLGKTRKKETEERNSIKSPQNVKKVKTPIKKNQSSEDTTGRTINGISEDSLKEVCLLVMRLHELHRTILQLQKELPKNNDLAVHFLKVISAQQENFRKEIRKSQKTILQCYERMLVSYNDPNKAALEIARRTSLNSEDIINILSCCLLLEGASEMEKLKIDGVEQTKQPQSQRIPETLPTELEIINESFIRPSVDNQHFVSSHPSSSSSPETIQRLTMEYTIPREPPEKVQSVNKVLVPPYNRLMERTQYDRNNLPNFTKVQIYGSPSAPIHDRRLKDQYFVSRNPPQIMSNQPAYVQSRPVHLIQRSNRNRLNYYPDIRRQSNLSSTQQRIRSYPSFTESNPYVMNYIPENYIVPQGYRRNLVSSNAGFAIPRPVVQSTVECFSAPNNSASNWSNGPRYNIPSSFETIPQNQIPTSSSDVQWPLVGCSSSPAQPYSNQVLSRQTSIPSERISNEKLERNSQVEANPPVDTNISENILDPTVPQKLTMKNCRLQAGPVLSIDSDGEVTEKSNLNQPVREDELKKTKKSNTKDSKSRVYVCALNGCENPGVRICKGCQSTIYCSGTCQLKHWTHKHKVECYQLKELRVQHGEL